MQNSFWINISIPAIILKSRLTLPHFLFREGHECSMCLFTDLSTWRDIPNDNIGQVERNNSNEPQFEMQYTWHNLADIPASSCSVHGELVDDFLAFEMM